MSLALSHSRFFFRVILADSATCITVWDMCACYTRMYTVNTKYMAKALAILKHISQC